jgi:hypothetical protein
MRNRKPDSDGSPVTHSQLTRLLEVERRLATELESARRRAKALVETAKLGVQVRDTRLTRALAAGFPEIEQRVLEEQRQKIADLVTSSGKQARAYESIDDQTIDRLAAEVVDRLLDGS